MKSVKLFGEEFILPEPPREAGANCTQETLGGLIK